jgi:hypothetical protein
MDPTRFDRLTRSLSSAASRRALLAGMTAGFLASLPFALGSEESIAK